MGSRFLKGVTAGAIIGAAASMMFMPDLDRNTKRKIRRSSRYVKNVAGNVIENMFEAMK